MRLIDADAAIDTIEKHLKWTTIPDYYPGIFEAVRGWLNGLPSIQPEPEAISEWKKEFREYVDSLDIKRDDWKGVIEYIDELPSIQPNHCVEVGKKVLIDRQEALEIIRKMQTYKMFAGDDMILVDKAQVQTELMMLPSAQPDIIYCKDCKWYGRADKRRFYRGMDCLQKRIDTIVPDRDFCSRAERKENGH